MKTVLRSLESFYSRSLFVDVPEFQEVSGILGPESLEMCIGGARDRLTDSINCWFWVALLFFSPFVIIFRFSKNHFYFFRIEKMWINGKSRKVWSGKMFVYATTVKSITIYWLFFILFLFVFSAKLRHGIKTSQIKISRWSAANKVHQKNHKNIFKISP